MNLEVYRQAQTRFNLNPLHTDSEPYSGQMKAVMDTTIMREAFAEISTWQGYQATPLYSLKALAKQARLGQILYKDEGGRFELGSFKALGGAYAVLKVIQSELENTLGIKPGSQEITAGKFKDQTEKLTIVTATDGNHGRSVAWGAQRFGCACRIYIHAEVSQYRQHMMEELGATVIRIDGDYDDSVHFAASKAQDNDWVVVSDTSYPGYIDIPRQVMAGYTVMMEEIGQQLAQGVGQVKAHDKPISHVFVQAGVGGLAAAVCADLWLRLGENRPRLVIVEPDLAACLYQSGLKGQPSRVEIDKETIMAGLSCGEVSSIAWQILSTGSDAFQTISDDLIAPTMRLLANNIPSIKAGESAVAGLAGCLAAALDQSVANSLQLDSESVVLVFGTEGVTDPEIYASLVKPPASAHFQGHMGSPRLQ